MSSGVAAPRQASRLQWRPLPPKASGHCNGPASAATNPGDANTFLSSAASSGLGRPFLALRSPSRFADDDALFDPVRKMHEAKNEREAANALGLARWCLAEPDEQIITCEPASRSANFPNPTFLPKES